jgi:hypothetical protein
VQRVTLAQQVTLEVVATPAMQAITERVAPAARLVLRVTPVPKVMLVTPEITE